MSEEKKEIKFVDGLFVSRKETAPDFVKASLSFKTEKFITWLQDNTNANGYANVDILTSKAGKLYAKLNDFVPKEKDAFVKTDQGSMSVEQVDNTLEEMTKNDIKIENIPFK